jgi:hypothetical protein
VTDRPALRSQGLALPVLITPQGFVADASEDQRLIPLASVLNAASFGYMPELDRAVAAGEPHTAHGLQLTREPDEQAVEAWRGLTGSDPGDDVYVIRGDGLPMSLAIPRSALSELLGELGRWQAAAAGAARAPETLDELEERAQEIDRLEAEGDHAAAAVKRRSLLADLEADGWFDPAKALATAAWMRSGDRPTLAGYRSAGLRLANYLRSDQRREFNPDAGPQPILGAPVSVDWFRLENPPPFRDDDPFRWTAFAERVMSGANLEGGAGRMMARSDDRWYTLDWRLEDGRHPALVAARPRA